MPPRPTRPSGKQKPQKEPSYQIGIPLDGADGSALQSGQDPYDQNDTANDHPVPAPDPDARVEAEVTLPEDLLPADEQPVAASAKPAPALSGRSAASRSARSSRRTAAATSASASAPKVSSRRVSTIDRSALQKALLWIGVGVLGAAIVITGIILLWTHGSDDRRLGGEALSEAGRQFELIKSSLANHRGADARKAYEAALKALTTTPQLGGAVAMPSEEKPVVRQLAIRAFDLRGNVEALNDQVSAVQAENAAVSNLSALTTRFAALSDLATDIDALEKDVLAYIENPVDPKAGASQVNAQTFSRLVSEAKLRLASIASERDGRKTARSATPLRLAAVEVDGLIQQECFGDALAKLSDLAGKHPDADFAPLRAQVEDAAEKGWRSAKAQVETKIADWQAAGSAEGQRKAALAAAKERLNQVIQRFGIPVYVDQARSMLSPLP